MEVIPGILEKDWNEIEKKIELIRPFAKVVHVDIIDGKFAPASPSQGGPNTTFLDPSPFTKYSQEIFLELHMMVENPIQYLKPFADVGFKRFIGHVECLRQMADQAEFIAQAQLLGEVGLAIDRPTPVSEIKVPYGDLDCILIMTIKAGQSGQTFNPQCLEKIKILRSAQNNIRISIEVDGGINDVTIVEAKNVGATRFVANSFIFKAQNPQEQYNLLQSK